jgi:hypothetical protein
VINHGVSGSIEFFGEAPLSDRHTDTVRESLTERTRSGFNAGGEAVLRVARCE